MVISMLKIRRPLGRLIFNMGIAIPGKTVFLIETAPSHPWLIRNEWKTIDTIVPGLQLSVALIYMRHRRCWSHGTNGTKPSVSIALTTQNYTPSSKILIAINDFAGCRRPDDIITNGRWGVTKSCGTSKVKAIWPEHVSCYKTWLIL